MADCNIYIVGATAINLEQMRWCYWNTDGQCTILPMNIPHKNVFIILISGIKVIDKFSKHLVHLKKVMLFIVNLLFFEKQMELIIWFVVYDLLA